MVSLMFFDFWIVVQDYIRHATRLLTNDTVENAKEKPLEFIHVEGVPNFRGFGGYSSELYCHRNTKKGVLYRSAHPGGMSETGLMQIKAMGIRRIVDLTSNGEDTVRYRLPLDRLEQEGIVKIHCPLEKETFSVDDLVAKYDSYKRDGCQAVSRNYIQLLEQGTETIREILVLLKDNPDGATLIHCSLGKDRTGVIFALLFLLMEVPDSVIKKDYGLSTAGLASCVEKIEEYLRGKGEVGSARERALEISTAREDAMAHTIQDFRTAYGGARQYLTTRCEFTEIDITNLTSVLLDDNMNNGHGNALNSRSTTKASFVTRE